MKCPFKIPAKYEMKITKTEYIVVDAERKVIAKCNYEDDALFIQQVINSHEKLENAIEEVRKETSKPEYSCCMIADLDCILEQALKEAEKD